MIRTKEEEPEKKRAKKEEGKEVAGVDDEQEEYYFDDGGPVEEEQEREEEIDDEELDGMQLKEGYEAMPIMVTSSGRIYLESFSPVYRQAYDLLIAISDPVCRQRFLQEYQINRYSLFGAVSIGLTADSIISALTRLCKTVEVPATVCEFIRRNAASFGKVKLVLRRNKYILESKSPQVLHALLSDPVIKDAWVARTTDSSSSAEAPKPKPVTDSSVPTAAAAAAAVDVIDVDAGDDDDDLDAGGATTASAGALSFEVDIAKVEQVKRRCIEIGLPTLEEYDFRNDTATPNLAIELRPTTAIRSYQEKSLSKMFGSGRARSGLIVLPCGAGKTLVGVTAACTVKKSTLVLCTSSVSVEQWKLQFKLWSTIQDSQIARFTSDMKEEAIADTDAGVTITTYTMIAFTGRRSEQSIRTIEKLRKREWGLVILDEVHVVPAKMFRKVLDVVAAHTKLGLTATLVREDNLIEDLNFLIGPKLYEANWLDLVAGGFLANVQCVEVWCRMPECFYQQYLATESGSVRRMLYVMNPLKFRCCEFLVRFHEERGDKIIVFSDNVWSLRHYAMALKRPFIYGPTSQAERMDLLDRFRKLPDCRTLLISRVGDNSIDLPEANVIIQISSHFGSRRQEAQRLGRILRPKDKSADAGTADGSGFNAFFYTLVSTDTSEMFFSAKRQQFLIDQGYSFKIVTDLVETNRASSGVDAQGPLHYETEEEMHPLLAQVLEAATDESVAGIEELGEDPDDVTGTTRRSKLVATRTSGGSLASLSGSSGLTYSEVRSAAGQSAPGRRGASHAAAAPARARDSLPTFKRLLKFKK